MRIPIQFVQNGHLSRAGSAIGVYLSLLSHADNEGWCYPREDTIATEIGASEKTVSRHIKKLKQIGYIISIKKQGTKNVYRIALPASLFDGCIPDKMTDNDIAQSEMDIPDNMSDKGCHIPDKMSGNTGQIVPLTSTNNYKDTTTAPARTHEESFIEAPSNLTEQQRYQIEQMITHDLKTHIEKWFPDITDVIREHIMFVCEADTRCQSYTRRRPTVPWANALRKLKDLTRVEIEAALAYERKQTDNESFNNPAAYLSRIVENRLWESKNGANNNGNKTPNPNTQDSTFEGMLARRRQLDKEKEL
jgi:DNA-binding transcriptional ArsR family regulator